MSNTHLTPNVRRDIIYMKGGVKYMTKKTARFTFRLPKPLLEKLKKEAETKGVSLNSLILEILWQWIKENE